MKRPLLLKFLAIGTLMLLLLIPIGMIGSSIDERKSYSEQVVQDIARSSSYSQCVVGPVLVVPYSKIERTWVVNNNNEKVLEEHTVKGRLHFLPDELHISGNLKTELRQRGIYKARLYHADHQLTGNYVLPENFGIKENIRDYTFENPFVAIGISDIRGIKNALKLTFDQSVYTFEPGSELKILGDGVHASLPLSALVQKQRLSFSLPLNIQGTEQLKFAPIGKETHVELHSDWPHPHFMGDFLPVERSINEKGFDARWQMSYFSTNFSEYYYSCVKSNQCAEYTNRQFGVSLLEPINSYVRSDRAIKYALLFIALTFASFFLFEVLKRLQIHPVQYGLVGLSLAFFYLLLLSLSEHIEFIFAYVISSIACVALIGVYVSHVLQSALRGFGFSLGLTVLYSLLYGLLSAEDYALLMGSLLLFVLLSIFMLLTRKVDWYAVGKLKSDGEINGRGNLEYV